MSCSNKECTQVNSTCNYEPKNPIETVLYNENTNEVLDKDGNHLGFGEYKNGILVVNRIVKRP